MLDLPPEEHDGAWIVQLVHDIEVWDHLDVAHVDGGEVLDAVGDFVEELVHSHALWIPVATETDHYDALLFADLERREEFGDGDRG